MSVENKFHLKKEDEEERAKKKGKKRNDDKDGGSAIRAGFTRFEDKDFPAT